MKTAGRSLRQFLNRIILGIIQSATNPQMVLSPFCLENPTAHQIGNIWEIRMKIHFIGFILRRKQRKIYVFIRITEMIRIPESILSDLSQIMHTKIPG